MPQKLILLVEDNVIDEKLTLRALKNSGAEIEVVVARDGSQALSFLKGEGEHSGARLPALILLDLKLPKVSGLEVLREIRSNARTRSLQVVVLTSSIERQDLIQSYALGANSYIRKQVDFVRFSDAVRKLIEYWFELNEGPPMDAPQGARTA